MAKQKVDFSLDLGKPADPVMPDTSHLTKAGALEGENLSKAESMKGQVISQVGTLALEAGKGYLESGLESQTKKVIDSYQARVKTDNAELSLDLFNQGMLPLNPEEVESAKADISKYKDALDQGIMTREQALLAIDKSVKEYSRLMPGWASDFRKLAYNLTGVEHMGRFQEHALLTQASAAEKYKQDQKDFLVKIAQKQIEMFVSKYGRMPAGGLGGADMSLFRDQLAVAAATEEIKNRLAAKNATIEMNEPQVVSLINHRMADGMMTLSTLMQGLVTGVDPTTGKPFSAENKILLRQNLLANVNSYFEKVKAELLGFNTNQVTNATREQLMSRLNTQQKELVDGLKNQDNFDDFRKTLELRAAQAADVMNQWAIANPHLKIIKESGMATPEVAKLWIDSQREPKRQAEFRRIYGGALDDYFKSITTGGQPMQNYHSTNMSAAAESEAAMDALKTTNPGAHQAAVLQLRDHIQAIARMGWGETQETQDLRKNKFATNVRVFASQINLADPSSVREWTQLMADPKVAEKIKEVPQAAMAQAAVMTKTREIIENPEFGVMARLQRMQEKVSLTHGKKAFDLLLDPATGQIKVQYYPFTGTMRQKPESPMGETEAGAVTGQGKPGGNRNKTQAPNAVMGDGSQVPDDGPEIKRLVATANRALAVMNNFKEVLPDDLKGNLAQDTVIKFGDGYFGMPLDQRMEYEGHGEEDKGKKSKSKASPKAAADFNKEANKAFGDANDPQREVEAAKIRLKEVGGNMALVDKNIRDLETALAVPENQSGLKGDGRKIVQRELEMWKKAKELGGSSVPLQVPTEEDKDNKGKGDDDE